MSENNNLVDTTKTYYDSNDADNFYHTIWGGEDIHVGIYTAPEEDIRTASNRTVQEMAELAGPIHSETSILDVGSGYGGAARYLAKTFGCKITCLNLSDAENARNEEKNIQAGLADHITVKSGNFENIPLESNSFDIVWSEDAILHSDNKPQVIKEIARVLKSGGIFVFTDPMQSDTCPEGVLQPILERIHLKELGSVKGYRELTKMNGLQEIQIKEMPDQLTTHYGRVRKEMNDNIQKLKDSNVSDEYISKMDTGLGHWVNGGNNGYLNWGIMVFKK